MFKFVSFVAVLATMPAFADLHNEKFNDLMTYGVNFTFNPKDFKCKTKACWDEMDYLEASQGGTEGYIDAIDFYNEFMLKYGRKDLLIKPHKLRYITAKEWDKVEVHYWYDYKLCENYRVKYCNEKIDYMNEIVGNATNKEKFDLLHTLVEEFIEYPVADSKWTKDFYKWKKEKDS